MYMTTMVVVLLGMIYLLFRSPGRHRGIAPDRPSLNPYPAAAIGPGEGWGCAEVLALKDQRFLAWEAPDIPLPQCSLKACQCRYVCFSDRRADDRRYYSTKTAIRVSADRREAADRRRVIVEEEVDTVFSDLSWGDDPADGTGEPVNYGVWRDPADKSPPPKSSTQQE